MSANVFDDGRSLTDTSEIRDADTTSVPAAVGDGDGDPEGVLAPGVADGPPECAACSDTVATGLGAPPPC
jgi:hypothetical protein